MIEDELPDEVVVPPPETLKVRVIREPNGTRHLLVGNRTEASDSPDQWAAVAKHVAAFPARPETVAWIGGGFCIGPRIARGRVRTRQDVYELRPLLAKYCPAYATFVPGDYRTTLTGLYDVIVYDIGDAPDRATLETHLNPGGLLLGLEG